MNDTIESGMYTVETLARRVAHPPKTIRKWLAARRIRGVVRCGRSVRFDKATVERAILSGDLLLPDNRG